MQRIARITQALRAELSDLLGAVLASRPISASPASSNNTTQANSYRHDLLTTLRTFLSLGMVHEAEEIMRTELVQPFVRRTVTRENLVAAKPLPPSPAPNTASSTTTTAGDDQANEPSPTTTTTTVPAPYRIERLPRPTQPPPRDGTNLVPLTTLYNRILEFVERECGTVLDVTERVLDSPSLSPPRSGNDSAAATAAAAVQGEVGGAGGGDKRRRVKKEDEEDGDEAVSRSGATSADSAKEDDGDGGSEIIAGFQVLNNVVVDEIAKAITGELGGVVLAAGRPTVFHQVRSVPTLAFFSFLSLFGCGCPPRATRVAPLRVPSRVSWADHDVNKLSQHYRLTTLFLSRLEALSPTLPRLQALRSHPSMTTLLKRFQLPVYFQLRLKEAVMLIERAFEMGSASGGGAKDATFSSSTSSAGDDGVEGFVMSESEAVWKALERCWDDDVWLVELAGRFWKLTLQVSLFAWWHFLWLAGRRRSRRRRCSSHNHCLRRD